MTIRSRLTNGTQCFRPAICGGTCVATGDVPHTIHTCFNRDCRHCHGGYEHAVMLMARRRARAEQARREAERMLGNMEGLEGPEFLPVTVEELEY